MDPGILILDNNCYAQLESPERLARFRGNLRAANLLAQPSEVNLVEAGSAPERLRGRLIGTMREVAAGQPLLPWVFKLLQQIGHSMVAGEPTHTVRPSGKEWYLEESDALAEVSAEALAFQTGIETAFTELHERQRQRLQAGIRAGGVRQDPGSAAAFLATVWPTSDVRAAFAEFSWKALGLPENVPLEEIDRSEAWRLLLDAEGVAVYERAVAERQPKRVHRLDLIQLVYMGLARRRVLATADAGLIRAANAVLAGRYPNARVVHISHLLA